ADSTAIEAALAGIGAARLRAYPSTRLVLCGGDTSGNVLRRLGIERITIASTPWGNVVLCEASGPEPYLSRVEVVLKGGQMGHTDLLEDVRRGYLAESAPDTKGRPCSPTPQRAVTHG